MFSCAVCPLGRVAQEGCCPLHDVMRPAGTLILNQGEVPQSMTFIKEGTVLLSSMSPIGDETLCAIRGPGSLLGIELLRNRPCSHDAWALSNVTLCRIDADSFHAWIGERKNPMGSILELILDEALRRHDERVALSGRAPVRVARFLVERLRAEGQARPLHIEQQLLARMLGMRAETLSRALAQLRRRGILAHGRGVEILDAQALFSTAGEEV